ncbi:hypothetical protein AAFN85_27270 [Mucilaginibacter sp. CAU 1740]|uniref:hypothetical protein n=1 Tax=Mucilaginibacter sp. CAU 1740 TaxID=3140365 RepID=UPI00325B3ACA
MKLLLTPELLKFLNKQGFKYCLSKTTLCESKDADHLNITLTPARSRPKLKHLSLKYDTYFSINREPAQMAMGIDDTLVLVQMDKQLIVEYLNSILLQQAPDSKQMIQRNFYVITGSKKYQRAEDR